MQRAGRLCFVTGCALHARTLLAAVLSFSLVAQGGVPARAWQLAHGDPANSGFADVATRPALRPLATVPDIGSYAPGSGPVIGPDGTVYLGSEQGDLRALSADGARLWRQRLPDGYAIKASPVVDDDGSIYVVGTRAVRDHRPGRTPQRIDSALLSYAPDGGLRWVLPFPERYDTLPAFRSRGLATASPNLWRSGGRTVVMVPVTYRSPGGYFVDLFAVSPEGSLLHERTVGHVRHEIVAGSDMADWEVYACVLTFGYTCLLIAVGVRPFSVGVAPVDPADMLPRRLSLPMPGLAIAAAPGGGSPWIVASDSGTAVAGFTYAPEGGFTEWFRQTDPQRGWTTSPMLLPDGHSVFGAGPRSVDFGIRESAGRVVFAGPNNEPVPAYEAGQAVLATPARTADGRVVVVGSGKATLLRDGRSVGEAAYPGETMAAAAVSRTHLFVSTAGSLRTYDAASLALMGEVPWIGGGLSRPAIAPSGRVYALASNVLFIWPGNEGGTSLACRSPCVAPTLRWRELQR